MVGSFRLIGGFRNHGVSGADILRRKEKSRESEFTIFRKTLQACRLIFSYSDQITLVQNLFYAGKTDIPSDYNPISIPAHLRLDLGVVWEPKEGWEIGVFGRDLLEPYHLETMYPGVGVEPARVERLSSSA